MGFSIQDYLKKINSTLSWGDVVAFFLMFLLAVMYAVLLRGAEKGYEGEVKIYTATSSPYYKSEIPAGEMYSKSQGISSIFGSKNGKTYTFSWCSGSKRVLEKNRIYFETEESAKQSGRTLSKLCH